MKTHIFNLTFFVLILLCGNLYAQDITIGAKGGFGIPNLTAGGTQNPVNAGYSSRFGPDFGIFGEYHFSKSISMTLEIEYSSQGGQKNKYQAYSVSADMEAAIGSPYLYANFKSEAKMNYLLLPLMARYTWNPGEMSNTKYYAAVGPFVGFLLNAHQVTSGSSIIYLDAAQTMPLTTNPQSFDATTNIKSDLYTFNMGVQGYFGISHTIAEGHALFLELGGNYGFLSIQKLKVNGKNYTGAAVLSIGYAYSL